VQRDRPIVARLYLLNTALLVTHEIDSAYWHEWTLFHLPGGIQFFLVINFALLLVVLYGFNQVIRQRKSASLFSYILAGAGIFAFSVHTAFILTGHPEFRLAVSIALLVATLLVSVIQIVVVMRASRLVDIEVHHR